MGPPRKISHDLADQVRELHKSGMSMCRISIYTELPRSTCERIVIGSHRQYSDDLTPRQRRDLLSRLEVMKL